MSKYVLYQPKYVNFSNVLFRFDNGHYFAVLIFDKFYTIGNRVNWTPVSENWINQIYIKIKEYKDIAEVASEYPEIMI